jgi:hypothetical protein
MSQSKQILEALKHGDRLTPIDALNRFGCMRLASRISDLKREGNTIYTRTVKDGDKAYAEYYMEVEQAPTFFGISLARSEHGGLQ